jgi:carbonic anhydrase/acetyltransferase-like protein (isoleucine patch superfamily)
MNRSNRRRRAGLRPSIESCEPRLLLSAAPGRVQIASHRLRTPIAFHPVRPNTPVLPFAEPSATATFIDPSALILHGNRIVIGKQSFVGPYATLNAGPGSIKIGAKSAILDNASVVAGSNGAGVAVGDSTALSFGATVRGPSQVGGFGDAAKPTYVGPNALIDGAVVQPGAFVSTLARVGPGVNVPGGVKVLPGVNVTTSAEASNPALGKVVPLSKADTTFVKTLLANHESLAAGYTTLYQGNKATGPSVGTTNSTVFNGDLATVEGTSREPGPSNGVKFEPGTIGPKFLHRPGQLVEANFAQFRARVIGGVVFNDRPANIAHHLGKRNSIRADQGQPITIDSIAQTGRAVTISSPLGGAVTTGGVTTTTGQVVIGREFRADDGAVLLGGPDAVTRLGDAVTLGAGSVVEESSIGAGSTIGPRAFVAFSTLPPGSVIPDGWIVVDNKVVGNVQW